MRCPTCGGPMRDKDREDRILAMRKSGRSLATIAADLGISRQRTTVLYRRAKARREAAEAYRAAREREIARW